MSRFLRRHYEGRPVRPAKIIIDLTTGRMVVAPRQPPAERPDLWPEAWWGRVGALGR